MCIQLMLTSVPRSCIVLSQDEAVEQAMSAYIDDVCVSERKVSAACVKAHLKKFGVMCKDPKRLEDDAYVLSLYD